MPAPCANRAATRFFSAVWEVDRTLPPRQAAALQAAALQGAALQGAVERWADPPPQTRAGRFGTSQIMSPLFTFDLLRLDDWPSVFISPIGTLDMFVVSIRHNHPRDRIRAIRFFAVNREGATANASSYMEPPRFVTCKTLLF